MRISIELEADDIARLDQALARSRAAVSSADETDIVAAAKYALDHLETSTTPGYVRKRLVAVQRLIAMVEDEAWALSGAERESVLGTLVYVADPEDLIPDHVEIIGFLDDAILLELLLRRQRPLLVAYERFCAFRGSLRERGVTDRVAAARELAACRAELQQAMRRACRRGRASRAPRRAARQRTR
jgi:hypothetical protein